LQSLPESISFCKFSASANDFIVLDNRNGNFTSCASQLAARICARRYSVGADGLILIENSDKASIRVHFFNPDGNEFHTCGNGGRCAARFARLYEIAGPKMTIETNIGIIDAEVGSETVKLKFIGPSEIRSNLSIFLDGEEFKGHLVRIGEPHFVAYGRNIRENLFVPTARRIRYHEAFGKEGTNVHFIEIVSRHRLNIRSYERGVEDETLACGSGCISSAIATYSVQQTDPPITFEPHSGIPLVVHFQPGNKFQDLYLEGDARLIYRGELTREAIFGFPEISR
jgi:diaminopimelate epimerase